jgi:uncharacterized RDD family membrane protein YckC
MSDMSQGQGWWQASDAKWYPPHLHPNVINLPPPPVPVAPPATPPPNFASSVAAYPPGYGPPPRAPGMPYAPPTAFTAPQGPVDLVVSRPLAPWWKRLVAIIIDTAVISFAFVIIFGIIGALAGTTTTNTTTGGTTDSGSFGFAGVLGIIILAALPSLIYYGIMNGSKRGQTVGKMAMSIAVRDARTGGPIGFWRGVGRYAISVAFELLLIIPYILDNLSPLWDIRRQAWHDKVAHSVVVNV